MMHYQTPINIITGPYACCRTWVLRWLTMLMGCSIQKATVQFGLYKSPMISASTHNLNRTCFHWIKISLIEKL